MRLLALLILLPSLAFGQTQTWPYTTIPPKIAPSTILGNNTAVTAAPLAITNPSFFGWSLPSQTLAGGASAFTTSNSLIYGTPVSGINISGQFNAPASGADSLISPAFIFIKSDTADTTTLPANKWMNWFTVDGNVSAGSTGGRNAIFGKVNITGAPTTISVGYVGVTGIMSVSSNMGGTGTGCPAVNLTCYNNSAGQVYAGNFNAFTNSGATFIQNLNAQENDVGIVLGSSAAKKHALTLVQDANDSLNAYIDDSAFSPNAMIDRYNLTFTAQLLTGATTGTLQSGSGLTPGGGTGPGGTYAVIFQNFPGDRRYITITGADPSLTATWSTSCGVSSCGLTANGTNTPTLAGNIAPWNYVIDFGGPTVASASWNNTTLMGGTSRTIGPQVPLVAGTGIDFTNFTFITDAIKTNGFTVDPNGSITFGGVNASYPSWGTAGIVFSPTAAVYTDTTASGTVATEAFYAFPVSTLASTNTGVTVTNLATLFVGAPVAGTNVTATNLRAALFNGGVLVQNGSLNATAGALISGAATNINNNSNFATSINTGTSTSNVTLGGSSNKVIAAGPLQSGGTTFTLGTGTGACATTSTLTGGVQAGSFLCTGTAGASTIIITLPSAANGWACWGADVTSGVSFAQITNAGVNNCKLSGTIATTSDKVIFGAMAF